MKILVINSGSSSIKFQLLETADRTLLCKGLMERIGLSDGIFTYQPTGREKIRRNLPIPDHRAGIQLLLDTIVDGQNGVIRSIHELSAVGHRIVHGGEKIKKSELLTPEVIRIIEECTVLAPLHNPPNLIGVAAVQALLPEIANVGVFDTAFHASMPPHAYIYPLEYSFYEQHGIRRFGFHGTSHQYVALRAAEFLGRDPADFRCVTCHLGNGVSLTAVKGGRSVDTSLGFGTMCGVPMGTRAGDVDPAIILHLIDELHMSPKDVHELIYKKSGLKGMSGLTNDMRDLVEAALAGNERAKLALEIFAHYTRKYIAALATNLDGRLDAVIFTAGIGENCPEAREIICRGLEVLGIRLDPRKNDVRGRDAVISVDGASPLALTIATNEELMIALETETIVRARVGTA